MWDWARAIRFLGVPPTTEELGPRPELYCATTSDKDDHFDDPFTLQETLLRLDYFNDEDEELSADQTIFQVVVGAGIQGGERNIEMVFSMDRIDFSAEDEQKWRAHNNPLSMTCEGNYSPSRIHIINKLRSSGHPMGRGTRGTPLKWLTKPYDGGFGHDCIVGGPVHDDDKRLCAQLVEWGQCSEGFDWFQERLAAAAAAPKETTESWMPDEESETPGETGTFDVRAGRWGGYNKCLAKWKIPQDIQPWVSSAFRALNLEGNSLTTLPEDFFTTLINVEDLNLGRNCLFGELSPSIQHMKKLKKLDVSVNLIESLPSALVRSWPVSRLLAPHPHDLSGGMVILVTARTVLAPLMTAGRASGDGRADVPYESHNVS